MLRQINRYCSTCLRTRKFVNLEDRMVCQFCGKRLWRTRRPSRPRDERPDRPRIRQLRFDAVV
jgi:rRNA maturation endonuclease Nob1